MGTETFIKYIPRYTRGALYKNGYPFNNKLVENLQDLEKRTFLDRRKKPTIIIIGGASGWGKTTLATMIGSFFQKELIDLKNQKAEGAKDFGTALDYCIDNKKRVLIYDEAGDFSSDRVQTIIVKNINRILDTWRTFAVLLIMIAPDVGVFPNAPFDKKLPRLYLHLTGGNDNYSDYDAYSFVGMSWIRLNVKKLRLKHGLAHIIAHKKVIPNFRGHIKAPPLWFQDYVDASSDAGKRKEISKAIKKIGE